MVGVLLLVIGVPVGLLTTVWQDDLGKDDPRFSAHYALGTVGNPTVIPQAMSAPDIPADVVKSGCVGSRTWAHEHGGTDFGTSAIDLQLVGAKDRTVAIRNIRAERIGAPRPPETGTVLGCVSQGIGEVGKIGLDLDSPSPAALVGYAQGEMSYTPYFRDKYHYLENQKPEVFSVTALASEHSYDYVIKIDGSVDGEDRTWTLTAEGGKPFRISGVRTEHSNMLTFGLQTPRTDYRSGGFFGPSRCTTVCTGDDDRQVQQPPGITYPPRPAPSPPRRPAAKTPTLTVAPHDPESVAIAWAVTSYSFDHSDTEADVTTRSARYLTEWLREKRQSYASTTLTEGSPQLQELRAHRGWSEVRAADVMLEKTDDDTPPPLTRQEVRLRVRIQYDFMDEQGWSAAAGKPSKLLFDEYLVTMARQADGTYLVDAYLDAARPTGG
ncbi:hypothetical protein [Kitasatospora sp. NPDC093806]|uniref:hypothetical protein n=1 Tax=Kitasatospora sp. NPDC093806 TaxID=3155075 RepID=UPI00341B32AB